MEPMLILLGLFLVAAIWRNKELSDDPEGKNTGVFTFFVIMSILLICRGAGFVLPLANTNNTGLFPLVPALVVFAAIRSTANGPVKMYATIGGLSVLCFMILNFV